MPIYPAHKSTKSWISYLSVRLLWTLWRTTWTGRWSLHWLQSPCLQQRPSRSRSLAQHSQWRQSWRRSERRRVDYRLNPSQWILSLQRRRGGARRDPEPSLWYQSIWLFLGRPVAAGRWCRCWAEVLRIGISWWSGKHKTKKRREIIERHNPAE